VEITDFPLLELLSGPIFDIISVLGRFDTFSFAKRCLIDIIQQMKHVKRRSPLKVFTFAKPKKAVYPGHYLGPPSIKMCGKKGMKIS